MQQEASTATRLPQQSSMRRGAPLSPVSPPDPNPLARLASQDLEKRSRQTADRQGCKNLQTDETRESCCVLSISTWLQNDLHYSSLHQGDESFGEVSPSTLADMHSRKSQSILISGASRQSVDNIYVTNQVIVEEAG